MVDSSLCSFERALMICISYLPYLADGLDWLDSFTLHMVMVMYMIDNGSVPELADTICEDSTDLEAFVSHSCSFTLSFTSLRSLPSLR